MVNTAGDSIKKSTYTTQTITNVSTVIGQGCAVIQNFVTGLLPPDYFKFINIASNLSSVNGRLTADNVKLLRKANPALSILPSYRAVERATDRYTTPNNFLMGPGNALVNMESAGIFTLFDHDARSDITFTCSRITLDFAIGIRVETRLDMWNTHYYLQERLLPAKTFYINDCKMRIPVPSQMIQLAAQSGNFTPDQITSDDFLRFMRQFSKFPIHCLMDASTNSKRFFFEIQTNILVTMESSLSGDVNMIGRSEKRSVISFQLSTEFTFPTHFIFKGQPITDDMIPDLIVDPDKITVLLDIGNSAPRDFIGNHQKYVYQEFVCEANVPYEIMNYGEIIPDELKAIIAYNNSKSIDPDTYLTFRIFGRTFSLTEHEFVNDWNTFTALLENPLINQNYAITIYIDMNEVYAHRTRATSTNK